MTISEDRIKQVLANVFGVDVATVDENTSIDTVPEWDSLKHLNLVLALESEFDITMTEEQSVEILSYPLIKAVMEELGIRLNSV